MVRHGWTSRRRPPVVHRARDRYRSAVRPVPARRALRRRREAPQRRDARAQAAVRDRPQRRAGRWPHRSPRALDEVDARRRTDPHPVAPRWIDVDKWIAKRRFTLDGVEVECSPTRDSSPSCDVEIVAVGSAGTPAWSLAFAAHGPQYSRLATIRAAWQALVLTGARTIRELGLDRSKSMGYAEWLARRRP
jgi:hypothetical protein